MARILIVGYGNPLRADDGLGWHAAEALTKQLASEDAEVLFCHQLTPELAETVSLSDAVIFIDATRDGEPGELICRPLDATANGERFSHHLTMGGVLALSRQLYRRSPRAFLISICGMEFGYGEKLSAVVEDSFPRLVGLVEQLVIELSAKATTPAV